MPRAILLVDDDKDDHVFFTHALAQVDKSIGLLHARDGRAALDMLHTDVPLPDFIFLDLNMPGMDGKQCLSELKKNHPLCQIPVIVCTTSNYEKDIHDAKIMQAHGFATKSPYFDDLVRLIEVVLNLPPPGFYLNSRLEIFRHFNAVAQ